MVEVMNMMLTQKESSLLNDLKTHEQLCVDKYARYEQQARDPQLKALFASLKQKEQQHLQTIQQMQQGVTPVPFSGQTRPQPANEPAYGAAPSEQKQQDAYLCQDALSMEKHVSGLYDTCIFEFADPAARQALNAIQQEEQQHGQQLWAYMARNGMVS